MTIAAMIIGSKHDKTGQGFHQPKPAPPVEEASEVVPTS